VYSIVPDPQTDLIKGLNEKNAAVFASFLTAIQAEDITKAAAYINACKLSSTKFAESISSARDGRGNTALHLIAKSGNAALWDLVANSGYKASAFSTWSPHHIFDFTAKNDYGLTPIEVAVKAGNVKIVEGMKPMYSYSEKDFQALLKSAQENCERKDSKKKFKL
jgi:ankyrin repeat protein